MYPQPIGETHMSKRHKERSLLEFHKTFFTEEARVQHLGEMRWPDGFRCPRCGHEEAGLYAREIFWIASRAVQKSV